MAPRSTPLEGVQEGIVEGIEVSLVVNAERARRMW